MSESDGGFVVERVDAEVGAIAYDAVRAYLKRIGEPTAGRTLFFASSRGARSLALLVHGGPSDGRERTWWPDRNADLAGELARSLRCRAWAWGREDRVGSEFVTGFGPDGQQVSDEHLNWDDIPQAEEDDEGEESSFLRPIARLSHELGSWEASETNDWAALDLDQPFDPSTLADYLLAFTVETPKPAKGHGELSVFLMQCVLADAKKIAQPAGVELGAVFWAAWDLAKPAILEEATNAQGEKLELSPSGGAPVLGMAKKPPKLSDKRQSTPDLVTLNLPRAVIKEIRALAIHADVQYGQVVNRAYLLARERLWRGEPGQPSK